MSTIKPSRSGAVARRRDCARAALAWAESVTRVAETGVPDADYADARDVFDERELVDLTIAIGLMNLYNRMAVSFRNTPQAVLPK